jgi:hypothetical protein
LRRITGFEFRLFREQHPCAYSDENYGEDAAEPELRYVLRAEAAEEAAYCESSGD